MGWMLWCSNPGREKKFVLQYVLVRQVEVVGVVSRLWAGLSGVRILAGTRDFSHLRNIHTDFGVH